ncbi:MAG: heme lyase CcmF/NrfE family subunit, partial [Alphaproteobacteria bacterium]
MIAACGTGFLCVAVLTSVIQALLWGMRDRAFYVQWLPACALGTSVATSGAFAALMLAFALSDFQVQAVYMHSHTLKPLIFKLAATWGNHEGSILLWCWILTLYTAWMTLATPRALRGEVATSLHVMGVIQACFIAYTLVTSNPFVELYPVPHEGRGLNPLLQDIGLAMHPPMLYFGYVGFAAAFALAIAGLVHKRSDRDYANFLYPYIMLPWACLTLGIGLGSWWAYRELGWGGWWFWDPVENASLLPWLTATALFHSNKVMMRQENMQRWVMLLALLTFILSMMGTFLVRSGLLTSVHSFASDPMRGVAILAMIAVIAGAGLVIFFIYAPRLPVSTPVRFASREMLVMLNNVLLMLCMMAILLAMMYPLIYEAYAGRSVTIGTRYYNHVFMLFMLPLVALC